MIDPITLIRQTAGSYGHPELAALALATATQEAPTFLRTGDPNDAIGDGGDSVGPYQENIHGAGAGLTFAQRSDIVASTKRFIDRVLAYLRSGGGGSPGDIAVSVQRPREDLRPGYIANVNSFYEQYGGTGVLGGAGAPAPAPSVDPTLPGDKSCRKGFHLETISIGPVRYNRCVPDVNLPDALAKVPELIAPKIISGLAPLVTGIVVIAVIAGLGFMGTKRIFG